MPLPDPDLWQIDMRLGRAPVHWAHPPLLPRDLDDNRVLGIFLGREPVEGDVVDEITAIIKGVDFFGHTTTFRPKAETTAAVEEALGKALGGPITLSRCRAELDGWVGRFAGQQVIVSIAAD
jgi:hypothetical protein